MCLPSNQKWCMCSVFIGGYRQSVTSHTLKKPYNLILYTKFTTNIWDIESPLTISLHSVYIRRYLSRVPVTSGIVSDPNSLSVGSVWELRCGVHKKRVKLKLGNKRSYWGRRGPQFRGTGSSRPSGSSWDGLHLDVGVGSVGEGAAQQ